MITGTLSHIEDVAYGDYFTMGTTRENYRMVDTYKLIGENTKTGKRKAFSTGVCVLKTSELDV